jgi:protein-disulfide isomerase
MSNRQARREQQRQSRGGRTRPGQQRRPTASSGGGGGPGDFISRPFLLIAGGLVLGLIAVIVGVIVFGSGASDSNEVDNLVAARASFPGDLANDYELGQDDAPLVITEYEDFQCPFCLRYTANNEPGIIADYVASGQVKLVFKHFAVLGIESVQAGMATECAAQQDRFWDMHHELFLLQAEEGQIGNERVNVGRFSEEALRGIAAGLNLDMEAYDACYADPDTLRVVEDMTLEARSFGLTGTPGFLFNGVPLAGGAPSNIDGWKTVIEAELEKIASATPTAEGGSATPAGTPEATPTAAQ